MSLLNCSPAEAEEILTEWIASKGLPAYRSRQILPRLWSRPVGNWKDCTDLPKGLIDALETEYPIVRIELLKRLESTDGTVKYLWGLPDEAAIESVLIPEGRRRTLCISSQVGCAYGCSFCTTGRMGFVRNLEPWEITAQVRELILESEGREINNVVFMGMGEPLHNWGAVDVALSILNDPRGFRIGARRICVSTVGIVPKLKMLAKRPEQFRLALSLHSPFSDVRKQIMPVEGAFPLDDVLDALREFSRRVTFEYILIRNVNDRPEDLEQLAEIARPIGALVNLLSLHPGGPADLRPTSPEHVKRCAARLRALGIGVSVRRSRGLDISAACGQLWSESKRSGKIVAGDDSHVEQEQ